MGNEMRTLVIRSSEWARGEGINHLYNDRTRRMCCLGILGAACGIPKDAMQDIGEPMEMPVEPIRPYIESYWPITRIVEAEEYDDDEPWLVENHDVRSAISANDNRYLTDDERIEQLRPIFAAHGWLIDWRPDE